VRSTFNMINFSNHLMRTNLFN